MAGGLRKRGFFRVLSHGSDNLLLHMFFGYFPEIHVSTEIRRWFYRAFPRKHARVERGGLHFDLGGFRIDCVDVGMPGANVRGNNFT